MAWINEDDGRWEPDRTELSVGRVLYWLMTVIAALIVIFAVGDFFISWGQGTPILRIVAFASAVVVWLIGFICRPLRA
jgi:hypothetical protein